MDSFQAELAQKFEQRLENPHVINNKQVMISVLQQGINSEKFNFSYQNRENFRMFVDLGHTVKRIAEKTPGGILMFFPSYKLMETCYGLWCDDGVG
jgi:Rad3-related DNA helicase